MRRPYGCIYLSELPLALDIVRATHASPLRLYISIRFALSLDIVRATHASPLRLYISIRIALGLGHCTGDACVAPTAVYIYPNCPWPWTLYGRRMRRPYGCIYLSELPLALDIVRATHASPLRLYISIRFALSLDIVGATHASPLRLYISIRFALSLDIVRATHASPLRLYISIRIALGLGHCTGDACVAPTAVCIYPNCPWPWTLYGRRMRRPYGCIYLSDLPLALDIVRATHASPLRLLHAARRSRHRLYIDNVSGLQLICYHFRRFQQARG